MNLKDLTRDEQLALGGLVRLMIRADGVFTQEEEERVSAIGDELGGGELLWKIVSDSAQAFRTDADVRRAAAAIARDEARDLVLGILTSVAVADTVTPGEQGLIDSLRAAWNLTSQV
jgi:uncharacterized tellurite resistance protein B-like protein